MATACGSSLKVGTSLRLSRLSSTRTSASTVGACSYRIGDAIGPRMTYQVEVIGGGGDEDVWAHATVRDGILASLPDDRDESLPLLGVEDVDGTTG